VINNLVNDIHKVAAGGASAPSSTIVSADYGKWFETRSPREGKKLYFSEVGSSCLRKLWYRVNRPDLGETIAPVQRIKFFYGDMLEELVLSLARAAGHEVCDEQKRVEFSGPNGWLISGRIDAVIDGAVVDVKSVTKYSEEKFKNGLKDDPFGYFSQLNGYATVLEKSEAGFLTIQKELGHINYYPIQPDVRHFHEQVEHSVEAVELVEISPIKRLDPVPMSKTSKNMKLCTSCSYCEYKKECFPELRTFIYSDGPVHLVHVVDVPRVVEVTHVAAS
jgi:hypothetical protein